MADLVAAGAAYLDNGLANPHLYRAVFLERPVEQDPAAAGGDAFRRLVGAVSLGSASLLRPAARTQLC